MAVHLETRNQPMSSVETDGEAHVLGRGSSESDRPLSAVLGKQRVGIIHRQHLGADPALPRRRLDTAH